MRKRGAVLVLLWAAACHPQAHVEAPLPGTAVPAPAPLADRYEAEPAAGPSVLGALSDQVTPAIQDVAQAHALTVLPDARLARLSQWAALHSASNGSLPSEQALDAAARALGLIEPTPHFVVLATNATDGLRERIAQELEKLFVEHDYSHYGAAVRVLGDQRIFVIALGWRWLTLTPVPRELSVGADVVLQGALTQGFSAPEPAVTAPDGQVVRGAAGAGPGFSLRLPTKSAGIYQVELLAQGKHGTEVVANFPVYVGVDAPTTITLPAAGDTAVAESAGDSVQTVLGLINGERSRAGLAPLKLDAALSKVAQAHVVDMIEHGFVGHTSPSTGGAADRVTHAGIRTSLVLENIGRGGSLSEVHAGLMNSPGHRSNILHVQATTVGIGVDVRRTGQDTVYLVTQVFIRETAKLTSDASEQLLSAINQARKAAGGKELSQDAQLQTIASHAAQECFQTPLRTDPQIMQDVHAQLSRTATRTARKVSALLAIAGGLDDISGLPALREPASRSVGIGLSQGTRSDSFPNAICAVILLAQ